MPSRFPIKILGVGRCLPERVVLNAEIEARCGVRIGAFEPLSGVRERRWVVDETAAELGAAAAREAVADAGLALADVALIVNASGTPQQAIPDGSALLQRELGLGASGTPCLSVHTTCLSFLSALDVAASLIATGRYANALIITTEVASCGINYEIPESAALFGDAAAAVVVGRTPEGEPSALTAVRFETYGDLAELTEIRGCGTRRHPTNPATMPADNLFYMDGKRVLGHALKVLGPFFDRLRPGLSAGLGTIKLVVPHQASRLGLQTLRRFDFPDDRVMTTLEFLGNCVAASIPATLYEAVRRGRLARGDEVLLVGTGAGLSVGGAILTY